LTAALDLLPRRDLGASELWERSLARSRCRRARRAPGEAVPRSLVSEALLDLDGPVVYLERGGVRRDLTDPELWDVSQARARAKRLAAEPGSLPKPKVAGATLVVAALTAALPVSGGAHSRARPSGTAEVRVELLRYGSRGAAVAKVQRTLGIPADGIFGPQTRRAVRAFQKRQGLLVDGIVGPQTQAALARVRGSGQKSSLFKLGSRGPAVAAVQRALGIAADGIFGPKTRRAVRAFQAERGLTVDGIVGPQTLSALKSRSSGGGSAPKAATSSSGGSVRGVDRRLWAELRLARRMGLTLWSAYRPGSRFPSGKRSDHSYYPSKAIDVAGSARSMRRYARAVAGMPGVDIVIHSPVGMWQAGVGWSRIESSTTRREHYDHIHVDTF
jgi:peptidoglycan hydrolase-like protein with peptidoglycan-binding domain